MPLGQRPQYVQGTEQGAPKQEKTSEAGWRWGEKRSECRTRVRTRRGTRKDGQTAQEARRKLKEKKKGRSEARMKREGSGYAALDHM